MAAPKRQNIRQNITFRFRIFFIFMLLAFVLLILNLYKVVFIQGPELREEASSIYIKERMVEATRGNIYSDDGSLLATSLPKYRLGMDPSVYNKSTKAEKLFTANVRELAEHLANFFKDRTADEYYDKIVSAKKNKRTYLLLNNRLLDYQERKLVMNFPLFRENKKSPVKTGIVFDKVNVRYAPFGQMAYRTVGYMKDKVKVGLEGAFDTELRGVPGKGYFAKMDKNTWRPVENTPEIIPQRGVDLQTTIDVDIQDIVELSLMKALADFKGNYATAIVMETATGEIKAISNLTKNDKSPTGYSEFANHAIEVSENDPGSVFKLPSMMAMLEESHMPLTDMVTTGGKYTVYNKTMTDSHDYGTITVQGVIEHSSNIGTIKLMQRVFASKQAKFYDYLKKFHLIDPLDFQITPRYKKPNFPLPPKWDALQYMWSSVGYSSNTSPLHLLTFYNAIANNGYWIQPMIVKKATIGNEVITDFTEQQKKDKEPICSSETLKKIKIMLEGVVERGTGTNLKGTPYGIAGKTGTAQRRVNGQYIKGTYYVSFIGYFPVKKPKYTMLVAMDKPEGSSEGTYARQVTAPVFKDISDHIYARDMKLQRRLSGYLPDSLNNAKLTHVIHPLDHGVLYANLGFPKVEEDGRWMQFSLDKKAVQNVPVSLLPKVVPNVMGMNLRDALFALENRGFKVRANGMGNVTSQSIPAGTPLRKNALMLIQLH
jgi:cell division protein FtsI (penicillin-binding protein 3)